MKNWTRREVKTIMKANGYTIARWNGSHAIYKKENNTIVIGTSNNNSAIFNRIIKENNLVI